MASIMNSVLLQSALEKMGEPYNGQRTVRHLEKGRVVIFAGVGGGSGILHT
ncbi:hypothetical protein BVRB_7g161350 [Beta vulgaris subsp. vulgaris]|nr:hypothetical protein BVRB_7g161350 [Beta vulgaris subsp. vulgaris]